MLHYFKFDEILRKNNQMIVTTPDNHDKYITKAISYYETLSLIKKYLHDRMFIILNVFSIMS